MVGIQKFIWSAIKCLILIDQQMQYSANRTKIFNNY